MSSGTKVTEKKKKTKKTKQCSTLSFQEVERKTRNKFKSVTTKESGNLANGMECEPVRHPTLVSDMDNLAIISLVRDQRHRHCNSQSVCVCV